MSARVAFAIAILGLMLGAVLVASGQSSRQEASLIFSYASGDAGPGGVLALRRWLASLGYRTTTVQGQSFVPADDIAVLFVLGPSDPVSREDATLLRRWVERGHTLVVASDRAFSDEALFGAFGARLEDRGTGPLEGTLSPVLARPPLVDLSSGTARALALRGSPAVLVGDGERTVVTVQRLGRGTVVLSSAPDMFANANIGRAQNDRLVLNLLAEQAPPALVAFDEYHHGARFSPDVGGLLLGTAPGRAAALGGGLVFLFLVLRGRRFGSPLPLEERPSRSSLDHVRSFASLLRRSGAVVLAAERFARLERRRLARALGLPLWSDVRAVGDALAQADPALAGRVRAALAGLEGARREPDLLAAVARADAVVREVERR